jgi:hypothetical protein
MQPARKLESITLYKPPRVARLGGQASGSRKRDPKTQAVFVQGKA